MADFKNVILLGGTMNIGEESNHPWMNPEYLTIKKLINQKSKILGLCLGSQMLAHVMGARVYKQDQWEIGFQPIHWIESAKSLDVFHWHQYASDLPSGCQLLARSEATANQGFSLSDHVLAMQFHPEAEVEWVTECANDPDPIPTGKFCQTSDQILNNKNKLPEIHKWFQQGLENFFKIT